MNATTESPSRKRTIAKRDEISDHLIEAFCLRLSQNERLRRSIPGKGRIHIDRQVPFLCVYRQPPDYEDAGTERLVKGEASYLIAPGHPKYHEGVSQLVRRIVETLTAEFGAFLFVEVWSAPEGGRANDPAVPHVLPSFKIHGPKTAKMNRTIEAIEKRLKKVKVLKQGVEVVVARDGVTKPPEYLPLLSAEERRVLNCNIVGLEVPPVFRRPNSTAEFPLLIGSLRRSISLAMRQGYFEFARSRTTHRPPHFHSLGRKAVVKAVWDIDRQLAEVSNQFDYLLQLTPVNTNEVWRDFQSSDFSETPEFHYRPLPVDPTLLKRDLYKIPIERVEDPALQRLFREKQEEIELKLTMLRDRDTKRFLYESLQLFGGVDDSLLEQAHELLDSLKGLGKLDKGPPVNAEAFLKHAEQELAYYREHFPDFRGRAEITPEASGLIVSRGKLLINPELSLPPSRVPALLAHEIGTHLLTYYNGKSQPFQQLYSGLAGYEELQEGLAVLSEYLVGGLSRARMRQLAGRVLAVHCLEQGATFIETFRKLDDDYGFSQRAAYNITMRVYRGGGLTKDAVYLRGLIAIINYVRKGGELGPLFVGKMAVEHIPIIQELQYRKVLFAAPAVPRYVNLPDAVTRLERLRTGQHSLSELVGDSLNAPKRKST